MVSEECIIVWLRTKTGTQAFLRIGGALFRILWSEVTGILAIAPVSEVRRVCLGETFAVSCIVFMDYFDSLPSGTALLDFLTEAAKLYRKVGCLRSERIRHA